MKILHVASLHNIISNGVGVAVPQHVNAQGKYADVALINIFGKDIPNVKRQIFLAKSSKVMETLKKENFIPDLVVFHEIYHVEFCQIAHAMCQKHIPYIIVPHGSLTHTAQNIKKVKKMIGNFLLFDSYVGNAAAVHFLSKGEYEASVSKYRIKSFIVANGVNFVACPKVKFSHHGVRALFIGRLDPLVKGIDLLVDAIKQSKDVLLSNNFKMKLFGPPFSTWHDDINKLIREADIIEMVSVHDAITGNDKKEELRAADIFVQTSRTEGMPMGILEALSYGVPCVVTRGTTLGEIIEEYDAGWVAETTAESIADKLEQVVAEKDKWEIKSRNARRLIEENFTWDKVSAHTIEKYGHIVGRR